MLAELGKNNDQDQIYRASLARLLHYCEDPAKDPVLLDLLRDGSPLVRSSAVTALRNPLAPAARKELLSAAADPARLVRIRVAMTLAPLAPDSIADRAQRQALEQANADFLAAMHDRPDDWASHANLGNFQMAKEDYAAAAASFEIAARLEPRSVAPLVNASMAYSNLNQPEQAEKALRRALAIEPANAAANFNLGLLLAERGRMPEAEQALRAALKADPQMAPAAYNLGVLLAGTDLDEAIAWCRKAHQALPRDPKYSHVLAFYLHQKKSDEEAIALLRQVVKESPAYWDAHLLLAEIYTEQRDLSAAAAIYRNALEQRDLPPSLHREIESRLRAIEPGRKGE
jgi:tetratricopeptide (TPR) repeat protein